MRRMSLLIAVAAFVGFGWTGRGIPGMSAQDATPTTANHPLVGTWIVDTIGESQTDPPEIAVITADGGLVGLGANRAVGGTWEASGPDSAELTLVTVFDNADGAGYVVVRGPHTVDATGDAWTCECTFTVVGADGTVLDSGVAPASGRRLPLEGVEAMGSPLAEVSTWTPEAAAAATPAS